MYLTLAQNKRKLLRLNLRKFIYRLVFSTIALVFIINVISLAITVINFILNSATANEFL
jgi:hypothetical protein